MKHRIERPRGTSRARVLAETLTIPAVLFLGLLFSFPMAFHQPQPHHAKLVVADLAVERKVDSALQRQHPGGFDVTAVADARAARRAVLDRDAVAGFAAQGRHAVLYVAKADGASLEQALTRGFTQLAAHSHQRLTVTDVAPTVSKDGLGTTPVYFGIAWNVPGYILATTLLRAVTFDRRRKVMTIAGVAALFSVVGFYVGVGLGFFPDSPAALAIAFLLTTAVATFSLGMAPFVKHFFPLVGLGLYVVLSVPSSGLVPVQLLPRFFQDLHAVMPLGNAVDGLRGVLYFNGAGVLKPVLVLCAWIMAGTALLGLDAWRHHRTAVRRGAEHEQEDVPEPPVEDPSVEAPAPTALPVHPHHFGELLPMLEGTVRDGEQQPVHRAAVTVMDTGGRQLVRTATNARGEYAVTGLPEGYISVVVSYPGRQPLVHQKLLQSGVAVRADFTLHDPRAGASTPVTAQRLGLGQARNGS
ncbi:carboxypeptidase regulatory-like domain-containing protein [Streptomyces sp. NBC_00557]|uniref:carboxypeptidase regulatory-like domain-containing protein n=1 Tax=Streptomyces sp. NBC_00557 TaxID=2975776 RepID=UPI002E81239D|nr:carboxypeptidase regulatory-like domain-containing protein [Streptomyces sp. NBC_00557]WUC39180.1 carboxypeptidase regulatory-like domain-containing protein [Streptomyces sp. NBC_00557]